MTRRNPRTRNSALGTSFEGILGVFPSDQEIIGVYPVTSSSFLPHRQDISFHRGDTLDIPIQIQDDQDPADPIMINGSVIRWSASMVGSRSLDPSLSVLIKKTSYDGGIEFINESNGQASLHIYPDDTASFPGGISACWDLEVTRPTKELIVASGCATVPTPTASVIPGTPVVTISGHDLVGMGLRRGDIIDVQGRCVLIKAVLSHSMVETDFDGWSSESGMDFVISRGETKTVASGPFRLIGDITV